MGFPDLLRDALSDILVPIAGDFRATVGHERVNGKTATGPTYAASVPAECLVEDKAETVSSADGTEKVSSSVLTFFEPWAIAERDKVTIRGITRNVIAVGGVLDPLTNLPYAPVVWLK